MRNPRRPVAATLTAVALASCVPRVAPPPVPVEPPRALPVPPPPAPRAVNWRDRPQTPGTWSYRRDERGSIALFGEPGDDASLTLRCDLGLRRLYLSRPGTSLAPMTVRTTSTTRQLTVQPTGGTPPHVAAAFAAGDPLLDAMGFSRGRFAVEQAGAEPLAVPAWAEIERVTQDCRD